MSFREKIIQVIKQIPYGKVTTYGTVARIAGLPRGGRIVGGVLHQLSEKEDLPWQRIINKDGFISTKCLEHPKTLQKALLEGEGIKVSEDFIVDLEKYGWWGDGN